MKFLRTLFSKANEDELAFSGHNRLKIDPMPDNVYVIGDVHGEYELLRQLEDKIRADTQGSNGEKWIVYIGDLIDRGSQSASVIDYVMSPPRDGFKRTVLLGNHEYFLLQTMNGKMSPKTWLSHGGAETIMSYYGGALPEFLLGRKIDAKKFKDLMLAIIPEEHLVFLSGLPLSIEFPKFVLVHAGVRPDVTFEEQTPMDTIMIRDGFFDRDFDYPKSIVHGHTVCENAHRSGPKISIDTGAYATKTLSAAKITPNGDVQFLTTEELSKQATRKH